MRPVYANTFNVTHNKNRTEVALSFAHIYTEHNFSVSGGALTDVSAQVAEETCSVLMNREGVIAMTKLLNKVVREWGVNPDE